MSLIDILIILGCVAGGYWIVSSVMGPGIDITRREHPQDGSRDTSVMKQAPNPRQADWHLLLDVSREAGRAEIEAAYKRQLNKALASRDTHQQEQLRLARDAALSATRR
jgi:hypothetical protein